MYRFYEMRTKIRNKKQWLEIISSAAAVVILYAIMYSLGITCPIKWLTGVSCAGCGMTRFKNIDVYGKINDAAARAKVYDKESSEAEGRSEEITYINLSCRGTLRYKKAVCIGKYTAVAYRELTGDDPIVAVEASADGVIEAIMKDHEWA